MLFSKTSPPKYNRNEGSKQIIVNRLHDDASNARCLDVRASLTITVFKIAYTGLVTMSDRHRMSGHQSSSLTTPGSVSTLHACQSLYKANERFASVCIAQHGGMNRS